MAHVEWRIAYHRRPGLVFANCWYLDDSFGVMDVVQGFPLGATFALKYSSVVAAFSYALFAEK